MVITCEKLTTDVFPKAETDFSSRMLYGICVSCTFEVIGANSGSYRTAIDNVILNYKHGAAFAIRRASKRSS